jgi:hypothetical protein
MSAASPEFNPSLMLDYLKRIKIADDLALHCAEKVSNVIGQVTQLDANPLVCARIHRAASTMVVMALIRDLQQAAYMSRFEITVEQALEMAVKQVHDELARGVAGMRETADTKLKRDRLNGRAI